MSCDYFSRLQWQVLFGALILFVYIGFTPYRQKNNERFKFLLKKFRRKYFCWEEVIVLRKAILVRRKKGKKIVKGAKRRAAAAAAAEQTEYLQDPASSSAGQSIGSPGISLSAVAGSFAQKLAHRARGTGAAEDDTYGDTVSFLPPFADYEPVSDEDDNAPNNINQVMDSLFNMRRFRRKAFLVNRKQRRLRQAAKDAASKAGQAVSAIVVRDANGNQDEGGTPVEDETSKRWAVLLGAEAQE